MRITLDPHQTLDLAHRFAQEVLAVVVMMHLRVTHGLWETCVPAPDRADERERIAAVRATIHSIEPAWQRREFILTVRHRFRQARAHQRMEPRWQRYQAAVQAARRKAA